MKGWLRLYPRDWRERYGRELEAVLGDHQLSLFSLVDLLRGAFDAWRHPIAAKGAGGPRKRVVDRTFRHLAGLAFLLGAACSALYVFNPGGWIAGGAPCSAPSGSSPACATASASTSDFLALMFGLLLLAFTGLWLHIRRTGHSSRMGEIGLLVGVGAYLVVLRDSSVLPQVGPWPSGDDLGILGLLVLLPSMFFQTAVAIKKGFLPAWSLLPLAAAPIFGPLQLGTGPSAGLLSLGATWLLAGCLLLAAPPGTRQSLGDKP